MRSAKAVYLLAALCMALAGVSVCSAAILSGTTLRGLTGWTAPSTDFPGIQMRVQCACSASMVGPTSIDIVSWYPRKVQINGNVAAAGVSTNASGLLSYGIPIRLYINEVNTPVVVQLLFSVSPEIAGDSLPAPAPRQNSLQFQHQGHTSGPIPMMAPGASLDVQAYCTGDPTGTWYVTWSNGSPSDVLLTWRAWSEKGHQPYQLRVPGFKAASFRTDLPCEAPPYDSGIYFAIDKAVPIQPHPPSDSGAGRP